MTHKALHFVVIATMNLENMIRSRCKWFACWIRGQVDQRNVRVETENPFEILKMKNRREKISTQTWSDEIRWNPYKRTILHNLVVIMFITLQLFFHLMFIAVLNFHFIHRCHWPRKFHWIRKCVMEFWRKILKTRMKIFFCYFKQQTTMRLLGLSCDRNFVS